MANPSYPENDLLRTIANQLGMRYCRTFTNGYKSGSRLHNKGIRRRLKFWLCNQRYVDLMNKHPLMPTNAEAQLQGPSWSGGGNSIVVYFFEKA